MSSESAEAEAGAGTGAETTYVHRPEEGESTGDEPPTGVTGTAEADESDAEPTGFGRAGWALVAAVVASTLVIPGFIYLYPAAPAGLGFGFFATYLALPMIPAVLLGLVAVWSMTGATRGR